MSDIKPEWICWHECKCNGEWVTEDECIHCKAKKIVLNEKKNAWKLRPGWLK